MNDRIVTVAYYYESFWVFIKKADKQATRDFIN